MHARLAAALTLTLLSVGFADAAPKALVKPVLILDYAADSTVYDFRPTVNSEGTHVVFERNTASTDQPVYLYIADLRYRAPPQMLVGIPAARANWCWTHGATTDGKIAWGSDQGVFVVDPFNPPTTPTPVDASQGLAYPAWYPNCRDVVVKQTSNGVNGGPALVRLNTESGPPYSRLLSGPKTLAGFVDVNRTAPNLLVFAGQPAGSPYQENFNYVYLADTSRIPIAVRPLDQMAPSSYSARYQGRAPAWSPDGQWVVFESNRACQNPNLYSLYLQDGQGATPAVQVTECKYNAQHGRFMPQTPGSGAVHVITAVALHPQCNVIGGFTQKCTNASYANANGIAAVDVTEFVHPSAGQ